MADGSSHHQVPDATVRILMVRGGAVARTHVRGWTLARQKALTLVTVVGLAYWMFGNVYEAVVLSPNWVLDSPAQLTRLNEFFVVTSPTLYFVPLALVALALVWVATWLNPDPQLSPYYRRASVVALAEVALNAVIIPVLITKMIGPGYREHLAEATTLAWWWNALNLVRIALTATTTWSLFTAFRTLDRR
jgi:hypothetical protein